MITTVHPKYFIDANNVEPQKEIEDSLILISIRDVCKTPGDVISLLEKIFIDIKERKKIQDFSIARELRKGEDGALVDALLLEPNFAGVGVDVKKLVSWAKNKITG